MELVKNAEMDLSILKEPAWEKSIFVYHMRKPGCAWDALMGILWARVGLYACLEIYESKYEWLIYNTINVLYL